MSARHVVRQALTIARRDFVATVFTPTFLLFLMSPLFTLAFGLIGGLSASSVAGGSSDKTRIVAFVAPAQQATMRAADARLRQVFAGADQPAALMLQVPAGDPAAQARAAFTGDRKTDASAALYGDLAHPTILYGGQGRSDARYLASLGRPCAPIRRGSTRSAARRSPRSRVLRRPKAGTSRPHSSRCSASSC